MQLEMVSLDFFFFFLMDLFVCCVILTLLSFACFLAFRSEGTEHRLLLDSLSSCLEQGARGQDSMPSPPLTSRFRLSSAIRRWLQEMLP